MSHFSHVAFASTSAAESSRSGLVADSSALGSAQQAVQQTAQAEDEEEEADLTRYLTNQAGDSGDEEDQQDQHHSSQLEVVTGQQAINKRLHEHVLPTPPPPPAPTSSGVVASAGLPSNAIHSEYAETTDQDSAIFAVAAAAAVAQRKQQQQEAEQSTAAAARDQAQSSTSGIVAHDTHPGLPSDGLIEGEFSATSPSYTFPTDLSRYEFEDAEAVTDFLTDLTHRHGFKMIKQNVRRANTSKRKGSGRSNKRARLEEPKQTRLGAGGGEAHAHAMMGPDGSVMQGQTDDSVAHAAAVAVAAAAAAAGLSLGQHLERHEAAAAAAAAEQAAAASGQGGDQVQAEQEQEDQENWIKVLYFGCSKGTKRRANARPQGNSRVIKERRKTTAERGSECPWQVKAERNSATEPFRLVFLKSQHNHEVHDGGLEASGKLRRLTRWDKARIWYLYFRAGFKPSQIIETLSSAEPIARIVTTSRQVEDYVYNWKGQAPAATVHAAMEYRQEAIEALKAAQAGEQNLALINRHREQIAEANRNSHIMLYAATVGNIDDRKLVMEQQRAVQASEAKGIQPAPEREEDAEAADAAMTEQQTLQLPIITKDVAAVSPIPGANKGRYYKGNGLPGRARPRGALAQAFSNPQESAAGGRDGAAPMSLAAVLKRDRGRRRKTDGEDSARDDISTLQDEEQHDNQNGEDTPDQPSSKNAVAPTRDPASARGSGMDGAEVQRDSQLMTADDHEGDEDDEHPHQHHAALYVSNAPDEGVAVHPHHHHHHVAVSVAAAAAEHARHRASAPTISNGGGETQHAEQRLTQAEIDAMQVEFWTNLLPRGEDGQPSYTNDGDADADDVEGIIREEPSDRAAEGAGDVDA